MSCKYIAVWRKSLPGSVQLIGNYLPEGYGNDLVEHCTHRNTFSVCMSSTRNQGRYTKASSRRRDIEKYPLQLLVLAILVVSRGALSRGRAQMCCVSETPLGHSRPDARPNCHGRKALLRTRHDVVPNTCFKWVEAGYPRWLI